MFYSFNSFLLSNLAQTMRAGPDLKSFVLRRFQVLAVIYVNLCCGLLAFIWNLICLIGYPLPCLGVNLAVYPLLTLSFVFLKRGNHNLAAASVIGYFHLTPLLMSRMTNAPLAGLSIAILGPSCAFVFSSSSKVHLFNILLCILQHAGISLDIQDAFSATFTQEQANQILQLQICSLKMILLLGLLCYIQKSLETSLWEVAQSNFERAEKINQEVVQAIEAKDTFVSSLSHEIRNPLNALKGSIDYLLKVVKDPSHLQILDNAKLSGEVLLNLMNNVLDAAKLKSDKMELAHIETSPIDLVWKVIMIHSERLKEKEIAAKIFIDKAIPSMLWTDSARLLQIAINLFSNALKFTPKRGNIFFYLSWCDNDINENSLLEPIDSSRIENRSRKNSQIDRTDASILSQHMGSFAFSQDTFEEFDPIEAKYRRKNLQPKSLKTKSLGQVLDRDVEISERFLIWNIDPTRVVNSRELIDTFSRLSKFSGNTKKKGYLKIQVQDNGPGIAEDHIPKLFNMFSQGDRNVGSVYGGSGLGLWICKQLCHKMGGDITLYTKLNQGTTFVFYIPINNHNLRSELSLERPILCREKVRALVVDDYAYNRDIHKLLLEREGVQVMVASDGKEALTKYTRQGDSFFDFVMMDIQMPVMDGFTAAKKIRETELENNWKATDIYFVSGEYYNEAEIMTELRDKGHMKEAVGVRCLRKPIEVEVIKQIVEKFSTTRRARLGSKCLE